MSFNEQFDEHGNWRREFAFKLKKLVEWLKEHDVLNAAVEERLKRLESQVRADKVMLAFVVFALSFAAVLEILAGSMRSVTQASDETEVALLAQSLMDTVGTEIPVEEGQFNGTSMDRFNWSLNISSYGDVNGDDSPSHTLELAEFSGVELYYIDLNIDWQAGIRDKQVHFGTVRSVMVN